jgi:hypothetical protein
MLEFIGRHRAFSSSEIGADRWYQSREYAGPARHAKITDSENGLRCQAMRSLPQIQIPGSRPKHTPADSSNCLWAGIDMEPGLWLGATNFEGGKGKAQGPSC